MRLMMLGVLAVLGVLAMGGGLKAQQAAGEVLRFEVPKGYHVGYRTRNKRLAMTEFVPQSETVQNWTEMMTVQVFAGQTRMTPQSFRRALMGRWANACPGAQTKALREGRENGYGFAFFLMGCPRNPGTGKPEATMVKVIGGNDSLYVVQKAWRSASPPEASLKEWSARLANVTVCDTRLPDRSC